MLCTLSTYIKTLPRHPYDYIENCFERKKIIYILYNGPEKYVSVWIRTLILTWVVTLRCKQFSGWLTQMSLTETWVISCHLWCGYEIGMRIPFPNNTGMSQIICICMLLITTFCLYNFPLTAYYMPYSYQCQYLLKYSIYNCYDILQNWNGSNGPVFKWECRVFFPGNLNS